MRQLYKKYIEEMSGTWSDSSINSESRRLGKLWNFIDGDAAKLWAALDDYGPYSRSTLWTRVVSFFDWAIENGHFNAPNDYRKFRKKNKRCFTNVYVKRPPKDTFEQTLAALYQIKNEGIRNKCIQLLTGGLRWTESFTLKDGYVLGKGSKERKVYCMTPEGQLASKSEYSSILRVLKELGLRPHKLRGIFLNELVRKGINPFELKKVAGWSSLQTAESYINADDQVIQKMINEVQGLKK